MTTNETLSRDEARQALSEIQRITEKTKRSLANGPAGPLLILWGMIWMVGFSVSQFAPGYSGLAWGILIVIGSLSSWWAGVRHDRMVKKRDEKADADAKALGARIGIFWAALFGFATVWGYLLIPFELMIDADRGPELSRRIGAFMATIPMFAYVAGGMWFGRFLCRIGNHRHSSYCSWICFPSDLVRTVDGSHRRRCSRTFRNLCKALPEGILRC